MIVYQSQCIAQSECNDWSHATPLDHTARLIGRQLLGTESFLRCVCIAMFTSLWVCVCSQPCVCAVYNALIDSLSACVVVWFHFLWVWSMHVDIMAPVLMCCFYGMSLMGSQLVTSAIHWHTEAWGLALTGSNTHSTVLSLTWDQMTSAGANQW